MKKKKQIKIFLPGGAVMDLETDSYTAQTKTQTRRSMLEIIEHSFYLVGLAVILPLQASIKILMVFMEHGKDGSKTIVAGIIQTLSTKELRKSFAIFLLLCVVGASIQFAGPVLGEAVQLKSKVLGSVNEGVQQLFAAQALLEQQQVGSAEFKFYQAFANFKTSSEDLSSANAGLQALASFLPQKRDADNFLLAAQHLSRSGVFLANTFKLTDSLKISAEGITAIGNDPKELLTAIHGNLSEIIRDINQAKNLLDEVDISSVPESYRTQFSDAMQNLNAAQHSLTSAKDLADLAKAILLGRKNVLLLLQNNNELRATGGFLGTFGALKLIDGRITDLHVSSIYDLDGQLTQKIIPPHPLYAVNNRWFMRDSNWFADFPTSAKTITSFYEKEGGESPDLIIAVTPNLVTSLLELTGPIPMQRYGVTLSADNFVEVTQVATSVNYDRIQNQPKQMLADFFPVLLGRLATLDTTGQLRIVEILQKELSRKQILLYSRDPELQKRFSDYNWAGEIKQTDRDYLSVVSSNLGGTKTDLYITQKINLQSKISEDGKLANTITITRSSELPQSDDYKNTSFVRVYVPLGATLLSSQGFHNTLPDTVHDPETKPDDVVADWESKLYKNIGTSLLVGEESDKTIFGGWMELNGGETKTASITYELPFRLEAEDRMSLLVQKQAGAQPFAFAYRLALHGRGVSWKNKQIMDVADDAVSLSDTIATDQFYGMVLKDE